MTIEGSVPPNYRIYSRCLCGFLNGNIGMLYWGNARSPGLTVSVSGVMKSVMGELTDSSNRAEGFALLPVVWSAGGTLGYIKSNHPLRGNLLTKEQFAHWRLFVKSPYTLSNGFLEWILAGVSLFSPMLGYVKLYFCVHCRHCDLFRRGEFQPDRNELPDLSDAYRRCQNANADPQSALRPLSQTFLIGMHLFPCGKYWSGLS